MSKIQLIRIVESGLVIRGGDVRIEQRAQKVGVNFTGPDGQYVSLAFDGRCDSERETGSSVCETYLPYADCPVINGENQQSGPVTDIQAMRFLRDALIAMDLGDYDPRRDCIVCGDEFVPAHTESYNLCPDCADSD